LSRDRRSIVRRRGPSSRDCGTAGRSRGSGMPPAAPLPPLAPPPTAAIVADVAAPRAHEGQRPQPGGADGRPAAKVEGERVPGRALSGAPEGWRRTEPDTSHTLV